MPAEATLAQLATGRPGHRSSFIYRTNGREWELVEMRTRVRPALKGHSRIARKLPKRLSRDEAASLLAQPSRRYPTGIRDRAPDARLSVTGDERSTVGELSELNGADRAGPSGVSTGFGLQ